MSFFDMSIQEFTYVQLSTTVTLVLLVSSLLKCVLGWLFSTMHIRDFFCKLSAMHPCGSIIILISYFNYLFWPSFFSFIISSWLIVWIFPNIISNNTIIKLCFCLVVVFFFFAVCIWVAAPDVDGIASSSDVFYFNDWLSFGLGTAACLSLLLPMWWSLERSKAHWMCILMPSTQLHSTLPIMK